MNTAGDGTSLAQTLIADPTYKLMTRAEKIDEARSIALVSGMDDDDLAFALAVEEADDLMAAAGGVGTTGFSASEAQEVVPAGLEPCREDRASCASPVAGNGRCLECGARRAAERVTAPKTTLEPGEAVTLSNGMMVENRSPAPVFIGVPASPVLARFKAVTGNNDRDIGDLLNMARSTVQATVGGRMPEKLSPAQLTALYTSARAQADLLNDLATEIEDRILI